MRRVRGRAVAGGCSDTGAATHTASQLYVNICTRRGCISTLYTVHSVHYTDTCASPHHTMQCIFTQCTISTLQNSAEFCSLNSDTIKRAGSCTVLERQPVQNTNRAAHIHRHHHVTRPNTFIDKTILSLFLNISQMVGSHSRPHINGFRESQDQTGNWRRKRHFAE